MRSLATKLTLGFLAVAFTGAGLVVVLARRATATEFDRFVFDQDRADLTAQLAEYYAVFGTWDGVDSVLRIARPEFGGHRPGPPGIGREAPGGFPPPPVGGDPERGPRAGGNSAPQNRPYNLADELGIILFDGLGYHVGEQLSAAQLADGIAITVDESTVGTLFVARALRPDLSVAGAQFLARMGRALLLALAGATAMALLLGVILSRTIAKPVRELTGATRAVAAGDLGRQVTVSSHDEIGRLAGAFNRMSRDLARAQEWRRRMSADIAHDLRTPLSVILGHAEALRDGVLPPTSENLALVHDEAQRLNRLVEDLRTLSQAESGEMHLNLQRTPPGDLVARAVTVHAARAAQQGITLQTDSQAAVPPVEVDPDHMARVLGNLVDNALSHTPPGGRIKLSATQSPDSAHVRIAVTDSGGGIAPEDLERIFERFYRADRSRRRNGNGSGLGLAISRSVVEAHGGRIWAENAPPAGASFVIELPALPSM